MELKIKNSIVLYSEEDHALVSKYKWYITQGYCIAKKDGLPIRMHRLVMDCPEDKVVDHINGNRLDNRRENLQITTSGKNAQNKVKKNGTTSIYKGVSFITKNKKFRAQIGIDGGPIFLGLYDTEEDAAIARDMYIVHELPDSNYKLNFPEEKDEYLNAYYNKKKVVRKVKNNIDKTFWKPVLGTEEMIYILISNAPNIKVIIDTEDYEKIRYDKWRLTNNGYIISNNKSLHREIMEVTNSKIFVDHIDRNPLNNTKANLRISNAKLNAQNKPKKSGTYSNYHGVQYQRNRAKMWVVRVQNNGKNYYVGSFEDEEDAAKAYDNYIIENFPDAHYNLNFPEI